MEQRQFGLGNGHLRRRDLIVLLGGAVTAWPLPVRAQGRSVIGYLSSHSRQHLEGTLTAFLAGLREGGFRDGDNVAIEYRWADEHYERLPALAADLVERCVAVIFAAGGLNSALAAKAATTIIPVVISTGIDPVTSGLVRSLSHPEANLTGVVYLAVQLIAKHIEFLNELLPGSAPLGALVDPAGSIFVDVERVVDETAKRLGRRVIMMNASSEPAIEPALAAIKQQGGVGIAISPDPLFVAKITALATLTTKYTLPAISDVRDFTAAGGLMSYGLPLSEAYREAGLYVAKILSGARPGDLPIEQASKFRFVINLKSAKALGLTVPLTILGRADEVIE